MLEAKNISMYYGPVLALENVSFSVREKEIVGLLGPNGAGKTTLMRILTTFIYPPKGTAVICGIDITKDPLSAREIIGYLPENPPLYMDMRVDQYIDFVGRARGLEAKQLKERKDWVIEATQISSVWKHTVSELSQGYRQRVGLAQALIHDPKVIILDEPTTGLDPMQIVGIRRLIRDLAKDKTIVFSTHILQEASAISDRLLIIDRGRIIAEGTPSELKKEKTGEHNFIVAFHAPAEEVVACLKAISSVKRFQLIEEISGVARFNCYAVSYEDAARALNQLAREKGWFLQELALKEPSLEEIFLGLFKKAGQKT